MAHTHTHTHASVIQYTNIDITHVLFAFNTAAAAYKKTELVGYIYIFDLPTFSTSTYEYYIHLLPGLLYDAFIVFRFHHVALSFLICCILYKYVYICVYMVENGKCAR